MAFRNFLIVLAVLVIGVCGFHDEIEAQSKVKKAVAPEKDQKSRSANPGREKGSFQKLHSMMNRTSKDHHRKGKDNLNKIFELNRKHKSHTDNMMNDNEGAIVDFQFHSDNDTNNEYDYTKKIKDLRPPRPNYEAFYNSAIPQVTGVLCSFEPPENITENEDMCMWTWNMTVSRYSLGFEVVTAEDVVRMNETAQHQFTGPTSDADNKEGGHFLYLPVDPSMENMVIKSPPFRGLREECKFEASFHQSKMQNASIRLISESTSSGMQWILMEIAGNNFEQWHKMSFLIGKVRQEVRIIIEITRPSSVSLSIPLPHIAADNIRMVECLPETPRYNGQCPEGQLKCSIMNRTSCIKLQQICDLVKDCDDGSDENQNCDKMPFGSYCNFEGDMCGFVNIPQPILKWTRHSGPTPTDKTGPNYDHTCGAPDLYANTPLLPPLTPAHLNHTDPKCAGYYLYVNMNVTGPNKEKADFASTAIVRSATFNPPPRVHGDLNSKYYNCCMIRFYYQQNGRNYGSLSVDLYEISVWNRSVPLWFSTKDKGENWHRAAIFLPNVTRRYYLEFKTRMGMRIYSDSAIDDFSLAPECFGLNIPQEELGDYNYYEPILEENVTAHYAFKNEPVYRFNPCGASGRFGPNQTMCDITYNNTKTVVTVIPSPPLKGVQIWEVPAEGYYTIIARGASGGYGSAWAGVSHGATARGLFELHKGELVYILPGHQGQHACKKTLSAQESQECSKRHNDTTVRYNSKAQEVRNTEIRDGGGGGGGGTYVFLMDKDNKMHPLLIAGGGGGLSVGVFRDDGSQHGRQASNATPDHGYMYGDPGKTSGAGGGWASRPGPSTPGFELLRGASPREGAAGGLACSGWADGGFGGGGGGCRKGGGGGGWIGGNTNDGPHGGGGYSYISTSRSVSEFSAVHTAQHTGHGEVLIVRALHACGCAYRCVALNEFRSEVSCFCPSAWTSRNGTACILDDDWRQISWWVILPFTIMFVVVVAIVMIGCLYLYNSYQRKAEEEVQRKLMLEQELALQRLREPIGTARNTLGSFNPYYGSSAPNVPPGLDDLQLPRLDRFALHLLKALGQGAFGEVYQGIYQHRLELEPTPVAVKTLPELSTSQAEADFFMEAAIMAKFSHPNIVHLIGVCFDRHPRFIVLELLAGGDLKNFLRETRPTIERATALTMKDLILCAMDVCKGCRYLELKRFIHRDIAARNCLLTTKGPGRVVKIADFGMARDIYRADYYKKGGKAMLPIKWMPPEAYMDGLFTVKTDVWSFGVLVWEVFALGLMPYTGCSNREVMDLVSGGGRLDNPFACPQDIYHLMCECWNPIPEERPNFSYVFDKLSLFLQDPEILAIPLPIVRLPPTGNGKNLNSTRVPSGDYLVPLTPNTAGGDSSLTEAPAGYSKPSTATPGSPTLDDLLYLHQLKVSQEYGNILAAEARHCDGKAGFHASDDRATRCLQSNSTDRLLSAVEGTSQDDTGSESGERPALVWETSFVELPPSIDGPAVDKLISITPTSPKPPENVLSNAIDSKVLDKTNHNLAPDTKTAPIASPDPPRINAWVEPPKLMPKSKPLCLDAAQLEQNLNALKKNSGSVNLNTMNILPPYINVVTPNKLSESKTIQIDPKKAVIYDLQSPKDEQKEGSKLKQSNSAASLLNGPMTDVPYADSDNTNSSGSNGSNPPNHITKIKKSKMNNYSEIKIGVSKQNSNGGDFHESEISC